VDKLKKDKLRMYKKKRKLFLFTPKRHSIFHKGVMEFHISRNARDKYQFDESLFSLSGNVIFANFHASRQFAQKINEKLDLVNFPERAVRAGQINAMGLIDEILHYIVEMYREQVDPQVSQKAFEWLNKKFDQVTINKILLKFIQEFPPLSVYKRQIEPEKYLLEKTENTSNRLIVLEEMLLLWLANKNKAFSPFLELFDDAELEKLTDYNKLINELQTFFDNQSHFGPENQNLVEMLQSPAVAVPHSLSGQLKYMLDKWGDLLGKYLYRLLGGLDLIKEEEKMRYAFGPGPSRVYEFSDDEPERFSPDKDWMPHLVLIAKSALVWLDQLSKKYQKMITRLDLIPDEELDQLAKWGFTGLWLIGVWERSNASKKIKQYCGNPEAESSAYSLFDYVVAHELGGEPALQNLKDRCWQRGIRLASDMVPNHTGIYSKWAIEHPDWYISQDYSPFPVYSFNGANLSEDPRVGIYIDDRYYERTDAAVAFKRVDFHTGNVKYIYHGNDGTSMPWNDTAQLNYLKPEVREAVIKTILHVARQFPIIRFDAAMTLTKRHYQRLWFPEPGTGGDIPSRVENGLTKEQFNTLMPEEFWREVVDRVAQEAPDTLLLAEAFWLMEGYFVRTLGMHRVYNSAFMNMLKDEDNEKYRSVIKKTIEFNPEILKRYVNFMNNPDEETAVAQFGKDDKYVGTCLMMITMPGLPMFGHGQVEGFTEKYGMEYRRAYWDEQPDLDLIRRHEREIFPVMKKRYLFSDVQNFLLYDFYALEGHVNENVFVYSNRYEEQRTLVVYNNKFEQAIGWIRTSAAYAEKTGIGLEQRLVQKTLGEGLSLRNEDNYFTIFKDHINSLEYIRSSKDLFEKGMYIEMGAFQYHVFWEFREVQDNEWHHYSQLHSYLEGRGVPNIDIALKELFLQPIHEKLGDIFNADIIQQFYKVASDKKSTKIQKEFLTVIKLKMMNLLQEVRKFSGSTCDEKQLANEIVNIIEASFELTNKKSKNVQILNFFKNSFENDLFSLSTLFGYIIVHRLGKLLSEEDFETQSRSWFDDWLFSKIFDPVFADLDYNEQNTQQAIALIKILITNQNWCETEKKEYRPYRTLKKLLSDQDIQQFIQVNRYQGVLWFNKEAFETLLDWFFVISILYCYSKEIIEEKISDEISERYQIIQTIRKAEQKSDFRIDRLLQIVKENI